MHYRMFQVMSGGCRGVLPVFQGMSRLSQKCYRGFQGHYRMFQDVPEELRGLEGQSRGFQGIAGAF